MLKFITLIFFSQAAMGCNVNAEVGDGASGWTQALPGWEYAFPKDHAVHPNFKTEWWYFTGNLHAESGEEYGYELTFFRQGMLAPSRQSATGQATLGANRFVQNDFKFAHFAISDLKHRQFYYVEKINRGAFGEAGFGSGGAMSAGDPGTEGKLQPLVWIESWSLTPQSDGSWKIAARTNGEVPMSIALQVRPVKGPVIEGTGGVSQKAAGPGNASHYYSFTRLHTSGTLGLGKDDSDRQVAGESWFDHEWASNQLGSDQVGWDWFCCQFDDGTELMLYAMRRRDGTIDPVSSGTWVDTDGRTEHLTKQQFQLQPLRTWKSDRTGAVYPLKWRVTVPSHQLDFTLNARFDTQELALHLISYWEGAVSMAGQRGGNPLKGVGYMELTGYAGALKPLQGENTGSMRLIR